MDWLSAYYLPSHEMFNKINLYYVTSAHPLCWFFTIGENWRFLWVDVLTEILETHNFLRPRNKVQINLIFLEETICFFQSWLFKHTVDTNYCLDLSESRRCCKIRNAINAAKVSTISVPPNWTEAVALPVKSFNHPATGTNAATIP